MVIELARQNVHFVLPRPITINSTAPYTSKVEVLPVPNAYTTCEPQQAFFAFKIHILLLLCNYIYK